MSGNRLFSDEWHRVANLRVALRPTVRSHRQHFRGELWYVLHDPFNNQFFRLRPEAWDLVGRLRTDRTVEKVWLEELERNPEHAPGQEDVVEMLGQLNQANLLYFDNTADAERLYRRYHKRRHEELRAKLLGFLSFRIPLIDPDRWLGQWAPKFRRLAGLPGLLLWLAILASALLPLSHRGYDLLDQANGLLAPANLFWLYLAIALIKALHETGHGLTCRYFGGEVHTMGIMFIVMVPLPYMDATSSWSLRSRNQRALVAAAGMAVELTVAALAAWVWAYTAPGLVNSIAYNLMLVASVSTLLFNANPLLRFDGYYIFSDLLDLPNLYSRSRTMLIHQFERHFAGCESSIPPAGTKREALWLTAYGLLSIGYRLMVFAGITLFVAGHYLLVGLLMATFLVAMTVIVPPIKFIHYLVLNSRLSGHRTRASIISAALILALVIGLGLVPVSDRFRAEGVVDAREYRELVGQVDGRVVATLVPSGSRVKQGDTLLILENPILQYRIAKARGQLEEAILRVQQARSEALADVAPLEERVTDARGRLDDLEQRQNTLRITAPISGVWIAPEQEYLLGTWVARGAFLGRLVDDTHFEMLAVVRQEAASELFSTGEKTAQVRLHGRADTPVQVQRLSVVPYQHQELPSAALGWKAGGDQPVATNDTRGTRSTEPFFLVRAELNPSPDMPLWHGETGVMMVTTGETSLLYQWQREFRQLLQRRFLL